jgi:hypothetical protein
MLCLPFKSICIPPSVDVIAQNCFLGCKSSTEFGIERGSGLTAIGRYMFQGCSSLQSIWIPTSLEVMDKKYVSTCPLLSSVTFESYSPLNRIEENAFDNCSSLQSILIPESVDMIAPLILADVRSGRGGFSDCNSSECTRIPSSYFIYR